MTGIKIAKNKNFDAAADTSAYSFANVADVRSFHESLESYAVTPLFNLKNFAAEKNLRAVFVKDESTRFGLKAFKGLGSIYAIFKAVKKNLALENISLRDLLKNHGEKISKLTFATTTDGNHGKGVSWAAKIFGCKSYVFMPKGTVEIRAQAIRDAGTAEVTITDLSYDDCVKFSAALAEKNGWTLIQDTSWRGYEEIPAWIMRGYSTLAYESISQMKIQPTHIFLQAGVGSMAGAVTAVFAENFKNNLPRISIVEPENVACFYETMKIGDGKIHAATGNCQTMMAGLNCATPCEIAWRFIKSYAANSVTITDELAADAMKKLAAEKIISGESGCAGFALANALDDEKIRAALEIDGDSVIFVISTEGATDPANYAKIIGA